MPKVRQPQFSRSVGCRHSLVCVSPEPSTQTKNTCEFCTEPSTKGDICEHVCQLVLHGDEDDTDTSFSQATSDEMVPQVNMLAVFLGPLLAPR
jgi:hypothetical protein